MTLAGRETSRLVAIFATIFLIQIAVVPHFQLSGYVVDLPLILVVLVSLHLNPPNGALVGFLAGVLVDLVLHTPFGMTALTFSFTSSFVEGLVGGNSPNQVRLRARPRLPARYRGAHAGHK